MKYLIEINCNGIQFDEHGDRELQRMLLVLVEQIPKVNFGRREPVQMRTLDGHPCGTARFIHEDDRSSTMPQWIKDQMKRSDPPCHT